MTPFTSHRLLVGSFSPALDCLKHGLDKLGVTGWFKRRPKLVIQPQAMLDGGLSEVEHRFLFELGIGAGARDVRIKVD